MIEEIFQDVAKVMCDCEDKERFFRPHRYECRKCYMHTVIQHIVFFLRNSDYQILPEDSVVLSREEYEELQIGKDFDYGYHEGAKNTEAYYENFELPKARKETAEKIIDLIKAFCPDKKFVEVITRIISERLSVEIKE